MTIGALRSQVTQVTEHLSTGLPGPEQMVQPLLLWELWLEASTAQSRSLHSEI